METASKTLGILGEKLAYSFLSQQGYKVLLKNYENSLGEIDLIARDGQTLVFVEVKTRSSLLMGHPEEGVTYHKRRQIIKVAQSYLGRYGLQDIPCRFDVVSIVIPADAPPEIQLIQDAFGEE